MKDFLNNLTNKLDLGRVIEYEQITGGLTNKIYKLTTDKGIYAVKVINPDRIKRDNTLLEKIEISEEIAALAKKNGISTVPALKYKTYIQDILDEKVLIYNWIEGRVLLTKELTLTHVEKMAKALARIHNIKVIHNVKSQTLEKIDYSKYYDLLKNNVEDWNKFFIDNYLKLTEIYDKVYKCYKNLKPVFSYVHKDLNRKNIIWNNDELNIIDFETATVGNPNLDFFSSAWFLTADVDKKKYKTFCKAYFELRKVDDIINSSYAAIIDECNWLEFSLKRALKIQSNDEYEISLGKDSIESSLTEIINYYEKVPLMLEIIEKTADI